MWDHIAQLPGGGLFCLQEVTCCAPHRDPFCLIAGRVVGQHGALEEQSPGYTNKLSIWLANVEPCGGQHWPQLHNSPLYVAQVPTPVWHAGHCRRWQANQLIPGLPCGQALCQVVQMENNISKGNLILSWDSLWWLTPAVSNFGLHCFHISHLQESIHEYGDLLGKALPIWPPCPSICSLPPALKHIGIGHSHCCWLQQCPVKSSSRNCAILRIVGAGGQMGDSDTAPTHFQAAISHLARSLVVASLPSVRGLTSSH